MQAQDREHLRTLLNRASGGVIFTTLQKFSPAVDETDFPTLTDRSNVVVIADEAHRSQYGFKAKMAGKTGEIAYGFAKYLRDALLARIELEEDEKPRIDDDNAGSVKIVMTGAASDPPEWQPHIGNKARRDLLAKRARDAKDPLRLVIVRDMWLTGFDAPSMHTMYIDKPMRGHGLMQAIVRDIRAARSRGEEQGLSEEEIAFYDALAENESALQVIGDDKLRVIAHELLVSPRENVSVDWAHRESARARLRVLVKRILRKYGYPPDLQDAAVQTVLQQAEALSSGWSQPIFGANVP